MKTTTFWRKKRTNGEKYKLYYSAPDSKTLTGEKHFERLKDAKAHRDSENLPGDIELVLETAGYDCEWNHYHRYQVLRRYK